MSNEDKIAALEDRLKQIRANMGEIKQEFIQAIVPWLEPWYLKTLREYTEEQPERTAKLGNEGKFQTLLAETKALQQRTSEVVSKYIGASVLWWHEDQKAGAFHTYQTGKLPGRLDTAMRHAAGELGLILKKYGYIDVQGPRSGPRAPWIDWNTGQARDEVNAPHFFPNKLDYPPKLYQLAERYYSLLKDAGTVMTERDAAKAEMARQAVKKLWDEN
jgi:hypothetical protein